MRSVIPLNGLKSCLQSSTDQQETQQNQHDYQNFRKERDRTGNKAEVQGKGLFTDYCLGKPV